MNPKTIFFGTDVFSVEVLEQLLEHNLAPTMIVTAPDRPQGRGLHMEASPVATWAEAHGIPVHKPEKLTRAFLETIGAEWDLFLLASYGAIIPQYILDVPKHGTLNVHPSLLPLYRGASPIESAMLDDSKETGVTIMLMDAQVDHGPIIMQEVVYFDTWPTKPEVRTTLATLGGRLLAEAIPLWVAGSIDEQEQEHEYATCTQKITKADGELTLTDDAYKNFLKIQAYTPWPGTFFFAEKNDKRLRIKITDATLENGALKILRVIPEGKKEVDYETFLRS
jgi:methionyl-tRNA formyltransferase